MEYAYNMETKTSTAVPKAFGMEGVCFTVAKPPTALSLAFDKEWAIVSQGSRARD
jgi:hypothetical protein